MKRRPIVIIIAESISQHDEKYTYIIPKGVAEASRTFLPDAHVLSNDLAIRNTIDMTGGKPIAVWLQSISGGGDAVNPLVAFYGIRGRKREVLFFCSVLDTTQDALL
jgi:hypothetical protein